MTINTKVQRKLVSIIADTFAFVRGAEANQAIQTVSLDQLIYDQIKRNGESRDSNNARFNPYTYDPEAPPPAGLQPIGTANFLSGTDTNLPTKYARILALQNVLNATVDQIKTIEPMTLKELKELQQDAAADTLTTNDSTTLSGSESGTFNT
jgi:hypothetical protein